MDESQVCFVLGQEESVQQLPDSALSYNWSELPSDLLIRIFVALDVMDLFSVRAVCKSWWLNYLVARRLGTCCWNQSPCLLYSSADSDNNTATLWRLTNKKLYRIVLPDPPLRSRFIVGSNHGWLATANERSELLLINPITRAQVALPPPFTIKNVRGCFTAQGVLNRYDLLELDLATRDCNTDAVPDDLLLEEGRFYFNLRVAMSADPSSGNCIVMILHMPNYHLSFARVGDAQWSWIDVDESCCDYNDFFYNNHDGLFYAVRRCGEVHTIDLNGLTPVVRVVLGSITSLIDNNKYIVQAPWGDILQVWRYDMTSEKIKVYIVDLADQKLIEIKNLRGFVLFIGFNTPFFLPATDYPMLTPNCIYLTDDDMAEIYCNKFGPRQVAVFNMNDGSVIDLFPGSSSWLNWPVPIWITPSYPLGKKGTDGK